MQLKLFLRRYYPYLILAGTVITIAIAAGTKVIVQAGNTDNSAMKAIISQKEIKETVGG